MITTQKSLPCLQEMVHNYLSEARLRFGERMMVVVIMMTATDCLAFVVVV